MKNGVSMLLFALWFSFSSTGQVIKPDLSKINDAQTWNVYNRSAEVKVLGSETSVAFDARNGDGIAIFSGLEFENGIIEFDVKGKNVLQQSFVGIAFHVQNSQTFEAVYFRPFNFKNEDPVRQGHSVQYISHPKYTWQRLRTDFPEQYENLVNPAPDPDKFFHAKIEVNIPYVKVYVENAVKPCLEIEMLGLFKSGKIGLWMGNGSDGTFKNLVINKQ